MHIEQLPPQACFASFLRRGKLALGQCNAGLGGHGAHRLGKAEAIHLHHEGEDVPFLMTAETVEVAMRCVDGE